MVGTSQIDTFSRLTQVSRETIISLNKYEEILKQDLENIYDNYTQLHLLNMKSKIEMALDD